MTRFCYAGAWGRDRGFVLLAVGLDFDEVVEPVANNASLLNPTALVGNLLTVCLEAVELMEVL